MKKQSRNIRINWNVNLNFITMFMWNIKNVEKKRNVVDNANHLYTNVLSCVSVSNKVGLQQIKEEAMYFAARKKSSKASRDYKLQCARKKREKVSFSRSLAYKSG